MHDFIFFSSTDWYGLWGSRQQIAQRLAKRGHRVLFIERPIGLEHWLKYPAFRQRVKDRRREGVVEVEPNLWIYKMPVLLPGKYQAYLINHLFQALAILFVRPIVRKLNFKRPILWLYNPENGGLIGHFNEKLAVYHCIDEWTANTTGRKKEIIATLEKKLIVQADIVFANSWPTYEKKKAINPSCYRLASGVDFAHFAGQNRLPERQHVSLANIPRPRIGYSGTINERLDYDLLSQVASEHPEWSLVLAGDPYPWTLKTQPLKDLLALPNVNYVGRFSYQQMPAFLNNLEVCVIPYVLDARGHFRSPLKLYEYLAAGKAVVAVPTPENLEFADVIGLGRTAAEFAGAISDALRNSTPNHIEVRQAVAKAHDWDQRVETIITTLHSKIDGFNG